MKFMNVLVSLFAIGFLIVGSAAVTFAQGNSGSHGGGRPTSSPGVGRGVGTARTNSMGRVDDGFGTASGRSNGRFDNGMARASQPRYVNGMPTDYELARFRGVAKKLDTTPEDLRSAFELAKTTNPDLKFGQFVAAGVIADNLSAKHPEITSDAILAGLANGDSIGKTLKNLGLSKDQEKAVRKQAKKEIEKSQKQADN